MSEPSSNDNLDLANKIARLVEERGWNQEEFARRADLNRQTIRQIIQGGGRTLRTSTISSCARALGLSVSELRNLSLDQLLPRMRDTPAPPPPPVAPAELPGLEPQPPTPTFPTTFPLTAADRDRVERLRGQAVEPQLVAWVERNPRRASELTDEEIDELLSVQDEAGGHLTRYGVDNFVRGLERKRKLIEKVHTIANTEYLEPLEMLIDAIFDKIQPYRDRR